MEDYPFYLSFLFSNSDFCFTWQRLWTSISKFFQNSFSIFVQFFFIFSCSFIYIFFLISLLFFKNYSFVNLKMSVYFNFCFCYFFSFFSYLDFPVKNKNSTPTSKNDLLNKWKIKLWYEAIFQIICPIYSRESKLNFVD